MTDLEPHSVGLSPWPTRSRRRILGALAGAAGTGLLVAALGSHTRAHADDDNSGSGSGNSGRGRGRGRGGDDPDDGDEQVAITGEVPAGSIEVRIVSEEAGAFVPGDLTVDLGQSVTFVNAHDDEHTATGSGFDTGPIDRGATATVVLDEPGVFAYACQFHPEMTGRIAVRDASGVVPTPAPAAAAPADATTVRIANLAFDPPTITVATGTTVAWTNDDAVPHTATALDGTFDSGIFDPGATFSHTFAAPGAFDYRCNLHPEMRGTVVVEGEATGAQPPAASDAADAAIPAADPAAEASPVALAPDAALVGVWSVRLEPDGGLPAHQGLLTLHADGALDAAFAATGSADPGRPAVGPVKGTWRTDGADGYEISAVALLLLPDGRFAGTVTLRETGRLSGDGTSYGGAFDYDLTDADGGSLGGGSGFSGGTRVGLPAPSPDDAAPAASPAASPTVAAVAIRDFAFEPALIEVATGTTVTWTNLGAAPHTATAPDGAFDTGLLEAGAAASATFDTPGTHAYACQFHPEMTGTVVVA